MTYYNKMARQDRFINQQLDALARRMVDGETTQEDIFLTMKYSEILKYKISELREWDHWKATTDANTHAKK